MFHHIVLSVSFVFTSIYKYNYSRTSIYHKTPTSLCVIQHSLNGESIDYRVCVYCLTTSAMLAALIQNEAVSFHSERGCAEQCTSMWPVTHAVREWSCGRSHRDPTVHRLAHVWYLGRCRYGE